MPAHRRSGTGVHVGCEVVHDHMLVFGHLPLFAVLIRVDRSTFLNTAAHDRLDTLFCAVRDDAGANLAAALQNAKYDGLTASVAPVSLNAALALLVHVAGLAADKSFVYFDLAAEVAASEIILHCEADAVEHKPSGLLGDLQGAVEFPRRHAIAIAGNHPHCRKPLIK